MGMGGDIAMVAVVVIGAVVSSVVGIVIGGRVGVGVCVGGRSRRKSTAEGINGRGHRYRGVARVRAVVVGQWYSSGGGGGEGISSHLMADHVVDFTQRVNQRSL